MKILVSNVFFTFVLNRSYKASENNNNKVNQLVQLKMMWIKPREKTRVLQLLCNVRRQLTCKELNMAKRYSNTTELLLTARSPNTHVRPRIGRRVTKAFAKDL